MTSNALAAPAKTEATAGTQPSLAA